MVDIPYQKELTEFELFNNTGWDYLIAFFLLFIYLIIFFIVKKIIIKRMKNFDVKDKRFEKVRHVGNALDKGLTLFFGIILSIFFALNTLILAIEIEFILSLVFMGLISYYAFKILIEIVNEVADHYIDSDEDLNHLVPFFRTVAKALVAVGVLLFYLSILEIDITAYLAGLSILGLGIAFALQNLIADFFASVVLHLDKPFKVGESIKVGSDSGKVLRIGIRSTHIRTSNGHLLVISNRELSNKRINNMSNMEKRRVTLNLGVDCSTPVAKLKKIPIWMEAIVKKVENTEFGRAHLTTLGAYSWDFQLVYHITNSDYTMFLDAQQEINLAILAKLEKEEVNIPFPTSTMHSH
ncbi:MAG: mechanosensitive ion channel [Candidatus Heimdallarchaeota archaeon]|nr:mechanosensitive ion channel [Candidatus Heimdallarchaeota archaeon]